MEKETKKMPKLAFLVVYLFAIIGILIFGTIVHENVHKSDYKDVNKTKEEICYLSFGSERAGYYQFWYENTSENTEEVKEIAQATEYKAYFIEAIIFAIFLVSFYKSLSFLKELNEK